MRLTSLGPPVVALALILGARELAASANHQRKAWPHAATEPYAPSPGAAPLVSLGYRETLADLMWIRALAYFGGDDGATSVGVQHLVAAIAALDPAFEEPMTWGSLAMWSISMQVTQDDYRRILALLEAAMVRFPDNYHLPQRAGEIYALRLTSDDPAERRRFKEQGVRLLSRAVHMPNAPKNLGTYVAHLQTELGQRDMAIRDLRELILYTRDPNTRQKLVAKLAKLTEGRSDAIAYELEVEAARFDTAWKRDRPELPASMYAVVGPAIAPWFDPDRLGDTGEVMLEPIEPLPSLADDIGEVPMSPPSPK